MRHLLWLSAMAVGCSDVKSSVLDTPGMHLDYTVITQGEGQGSSVNVVLRAGGAFGSFVELDGGDSLVVSVVDGEESNILDVSSFLTMHSYGAAFTTDTAGSAFELDFQRETLTDAPSSIATLPEPFEITGPVAPDTVISRSEQIEEDLVITWDGTSNEPMNILIDGDCFTQYMGEESTDSGSHTVPVSYFSENEFDSTEACTATITVSRVLTGTVDPAFEAGSSVGKQQRTLDIRIDP